MQSVTENLIFVLEFLGIVVLMFVVAYAAEKMAKKKSGDTERVLSTRKIRRYFLYPHAAGIPGVVRAFLL